MAKKMPAKKKTSVAAKVEMGPNLAALTKAGVVSPKGNELFSSAERAAIESLTQAEVAAVISTGTKMGKRFFSRQAAHAMYY